MPELRHKRAATGLAVTVGILVLARPGSAAAGNAAKPRVPASFPAARCLEVVDRSEDPTLRLAVGIPYEDDGLTPDEPPDSRRFQFFGLCRSPKPLSSLPPWITVDDVTRAGALDPAVGEVPDEDILELSPSWSTPGHERQGECVQALNGVDERIPITCEGTLDGVLWDTTGIPAGPYVVWGYTFEPVQNVWSLRPGVVLVHDGDPQAAAPAAAFAWPTAGADVTLQAGAQVSGCVAGAPGTTVTLSWATAKALDAQGDEAWLDFADVSADDGTFVADFEPPQDAVYAAVFFRATATDPMGRSFVAYSAQPVVVLPGCEPPADGVAVWSDACGAVEEPPQPANALPAADCTTQEPPGETTGGDDLPGGSSGGATDGPTDGSASATTGPETASASPRAGCRLGADSPRRGWALLWVLLALPRAPRGRGRGHPTPHRS